MTAKRAPNPEALSLVRYAERIELESAAVIRIAFVIGAVFGGALVFVLEAVL